MTAHIKHTFRALSALALVVSLSACAMDVEDWKSAQGPKRLRVEAVEINGVTTYQVVRPGCPDWSDAADWTTDNRVSGNFGCATANNLGLMLANPADYVHGRQEGPLDGTVAATGVRKYHEDRIEPLQVENTSGSGSSGSN